jgi:hypothetical protein
MTTPETPDQLHLLMIDHISGGEVEKGIKVAKRLSEFLRAGGALPISLSLPSSRGLFRNLCKSLGIEDPFPGKCPSCTGIGCDFCGGQGYVN